MVGFSNNNHNFSHTVYMNSTKKRNILITVGSIIIAVMMTYWFFYHTVRGSSFAVYIFGGWHAPLSVKWECGPITDLNVEEKFNRPLKFDQKTINDLKGFWYYSFFRQCLFDRGFDFKGNKVPESTIQESTYTNPYGGFSFAVPLGTTLASSNKLDVNFHDQLLTSDLNVGGNSIFVHVYLKSEDFKTFSDLEQKTEYISLLNKVAIEDKATLDNPHGVQILRVRDVEQTEGVIFLTPDLHVVVVFGPAQLKDTIDTIASSITIP